MIALRADNVGKKYDLFRRPSDRLKEALWPGKRTWHREIWALRDLYMEVPRGATWGIIGPNGAGKSTFLQLVTGTTRPTTGTLDVRGKVSGILELGHIDLVGVEDGNDIGDEGVSTHQVVQTEIVPVRNPVLVRPASGHVPHVAVLAGRDDAVRFVPGELRTGCRCCP